jgi:hypothetical protein
MVKYFSNETKVAEVALVMKGSFQISTLRTRLLGIDRNVDASVGLDYGPRPNIWRVT